MTSLVSSQLAPVLIGGPYPVFAFSHVSCCILFDAEYSLMLHNGLSRFGLFDVLNRRVRAHWYLVDHVGYHFMVKMSYETCC